MRAPRQIAIDFESFLEVPDRPEAPSQSAFAEPKLPATFLWRGETCKVNWLKHKGHTFYQAGVSFPDRSATLMVVKVERSGELKPVLCWYGPPVDGVMSDDERQAREACGLL